MIFNYQSRQIMTIHARLTAEDILFNKTGASYRLHPVAEKSEEVNWNLTSS
jgi:hypothetical protein